MISTCTYIIIYVSAQSPIVNFDMELHLTIELIYFNCIMKQAYVHVSTSALPANSLNKEDLYPKGMFRRNE